MAFARKFSSPRHYTEKYNVLQLGSPLLLIILGMYRNSISQRYFEFEAKFLYYNFYK